MEKTLATALEELKEALEKDPRVNNCRDKEKSMMENEEVLLLMASKDRLEREYEDKLSYCAKEDPSLQKAQHDLYIVKKVLDEHPLVKEYTASYLMVRDLYAEIDEIIFAPYRRKGHSCSK